jgi:hypothetical protein
MFNGPFTGIIERCVTQAENLKRYAVGNVVPDFSKLKFTSIDNVNREPYTAEEQHRLAARNIEKKSEKILEDPNYSASHVKAMADSSLVPTPVILGEQKRSANPDENVVKTAVTEDKSTVIVDTIKSDSDKHREKFTPVLKQLSSYQEKVAEEKATPVTTERK